MHEDVIVDQRRNIVFLMPMAVAFQALSWWLVHRWPGAMLHGRWHLLLIGLTIVFSLYYLHGGVRLLRRRRDWILERQARALAED